MNATFAALPTLEQLRRHVHLTLCSHDRLDPEQAALEQAPILRLGKPCGMLFQVRGVRSLRTHAVWAGQEHRILFYDSAGHRFGEVRLSESPDLEDLAA